MSTIGTAIAAGETLELCASAVPHLQTRLSSGLEEALALAADALAVGRDNEDDELVRKDVTKEDGMTLDALVDEIDAALVRSCDLQCRFSRD